MRQGSEDLSKNLSQKLGCENISDDAVKFMENRTKSRDEGKVISEVFVRKLGFKI
jgi:hypothetical protein